MPPAYASIYAFARRLTASVTGRVVLWRARATLLPSCRTRGAPARNTAPPPSNLTHSAAWPRIRLVMARLLHTLRRDQSSYSRARIPAAGCSRLGIPPAAYGPGAVVRCGDRPQNKPCGPAHLRLGPCVQPCPSSFQQHRLLPARPLPLPAQYALELALHTLLGPSAPPHLTTPDTIALLGEARKRSSISKHAGYFEVGVVRPPSPTGSASRGTLGIRILPA